jgi:hypothetical protein
MSRIFFLGFILFSSTIYAQVSPEQALDILVAVPWTKSPANLLDKNIYTNNIYVNNSGELEGYYLQAFIRGDNSIRLKLFSYAEPSFSSFNEIILMGYVQKISETEEEAEPLQEKMAKYMEKKGFIVCSPDSISKHYADWRIINNIKSLHKGNMKCLIYCMKDYNKNQWFVRTMMYHVQFQKFRDTRIGEWRTWWYSEYIMPEKLIVELERNNISQILTPTLWDKMKGISKISKNSSPRTSDKTSLNEIILAYEKIEKMTLSDCERPTFLIFKNYLARFLFLKGLEKIITSEQKEWLKNQGLEYNRVELGILNHYEETILQKLITEYPDSYWGQFAFLELLLRGFDTSGTCRGGQNQWEKVLKGGHAFLEKYPDSEFAPDIQFYMGLAAETLYNLGTMKNNPFLESSGLNLSQYSETAEDARMDTLSYYEKVLQSSKKTVYANHLKYVLPRLRAGYATGCLYYFCFYD